MTTVLTLMQNTLDCEWSAATIIACSGYNACGAAGTHADMQRGASELDIGIRHAPSSNVVDVGILDKNWRAGFVAFTTAPRYIVSRHKRQT